MEFALNAVIGARPAKPLALMSEKLLEWDAAVNSSWPLRSEAEAVFLRADAVRAGCGVAAFTPSPALRCTLECRYSRLHLPCWAPP